MQRRGATVNPFRFGPLALGEAFTDRADEVHELAADIRNGQDVVVVAPRRFGKSSLMWRVAQDLVRDGVLVAQVDLMRAPTKERLAEKLAKTIYEEIATPLLRARERMRVFASLRVAPVVTVNPETGSLSFHFSGRSAAPDVDATLEALLALPARLAGERDRPVALVLDEFQEVMAIDAGLMKLMRSVFQEQPEVAHVYLGSKRHMMRRIFDDENEPFWRSAKQMELGPIDADLFVSYAAQRFTHTGKRLEHGAGARALQITRGHPYATQELLYFLWEATPARAAAGEAELGQALEATLRSEHNHFSLLWDGAAAAQRMVLQALAAEAPARPLSSDYQQRHGLPSTATVQTALAALVRAEHVRREARGAYAIAEPFLAEWIGRFET
ncbi:MAG TPA: AAA family ATPase [Solirubrobacteraceae bacterium]|nr:AAA family ATPase [Solirubrobacteraceae bacterium]